jgi:hypothetical protein
MVTIERSETPHRPAPRRSLAELLGPLEIIAESSSRLIANHATSSDAGELQPALPRYVFTAPPGGDDPIRIGLFAGLQGDHTEGVRAAVEFVRLLDRQPELATGYQLFVYPVCNPTGFEDRTPHNRSGRDLNREFWRDSSEPEVRVLQSELAERSFHGIISLHTDESSPGFYGFATGSTLTKHLLEPALQAAEYFLPRNTSRRIDGFSARNGVIVDAPEGVLSAPPGRSFNPFHIILEGPRAAPEFLKRAAFIAALRATLLRYREFIAYAPNL